MTIDDDTMAVKMSTKTDVEVDDQTMADPDPADFDLDAWIEGLAPIHGFYQVGPAEFDLQARTPEWLVDFFATHKETDGAERDLLYLAEHVVGPAGVTVEKLRKIRAARPTEVAAMVQLAVDIDTKPARLIHPAFLRSASD